MVKRILCIEDDPGMRMSVRLTLESVDFEVEEAEDGRQGLKMALANPPDLIVCDIQMPGMDGFQTLAEIKKHKSTASIPFIFLTGADPRTQMRKGMNLGADDYIMKPFDIEDLIRAVQRHLEAVDRSRKEKQQIVEELGENITRALPHELRTPMTGILGLAELLHDQAGDLPKEEIKELAKSLYDSAIRMNQTLEKFWAYTQCQLLATDVDRLAASRSVGTRNSTSVLQSITEAAASGVHRTTDIEYHLVPMAVAISERYLSQIFIQIIDNALKFSAPATKITVSSATEKGSGVITVSDRGRGLTEDQIQKISAFMQFDRDRHEQQGLGLGLMIAKRLVQLHNGSLRVFSAPDRGTQISIVLPLLAP